MDGIQRGQIWWADLPEPRRSEPGYRRPVLVVQADSFNRTRIQTAIAAVISPATWNLPTYPIMTCCLSSTGLPRGSLTLDRFRNSGPTRLHPGLPVRQVITCTGT